MKQHITPEQLKELPESKLGAYMQVIGHPVPQIGVQFSDIETLPLASIGDMIEFLISQRDKGLNLHYDIPYFYIKNKISHEESGHTWSSEGWTLHYSQPNPWNKIDIDDTNNELCDVLWKVTRKILEQQEEKTKEDTSKV